MGIALAGLILWDWLLALLIVALLVAGVTEVADAVRGIGLDVPKPPLWIAAVALPLSALLWGVEALFLALLAALGGSGRWGRYERSVG